MLCLEVSVKPNQQHDDTDADKGRAEGLTQLAQLGSRRRRRGVVRGVGQRRVEPEELGDGYADASKRERGTEPGEKCAFCCIVR